MMKAHDPQLVLYHFPGACSQVSVCALEAADLPYQIELVNLAEGDQNSEEYLRVNPLGKVPLLLIDGHPLAENVAILTYIAAIRPEAGLFPVTSDPRMHAEIAGGLAFCGATLHPNVRAFANPQRLTAGDTASLRERGGDLLAKAYGPADLRLAEHGWWLGRRSIIDVYLAWTLGVAKRGGFDMAPFPHLNALADRLKAWPAYGRMLEIDEESESVLGTRASRRCGCSSGTDCSFKVLLTRLRRYSGRRRRSRRPRRRTLIMSRPQ